MAYINIRTIEIIYKVATRPFQRKRRSRSHELCINICIVPLPSKEQFNVACPRNNVDIILSTKNCAGITLIPRAPIGRSDLERASSLLRCINCYITRDLNFCRPQTTNFDGFVVARIGRVNIYSLGCSDVDIYGRRTSRHIGGIFDNHGNRIGPTKNNGIVACEVTRVDYAIVCSTRNRNRSIIPGQDVIIIEIYDNIAGCSAGDVCNDVACDVVCSASQSQELTIIHRNCIDIYSIISVKRVNGGVVRTRLNINGISSITCIRYNVYKQGTVQRATTSKNIDRLVDVVHNYIGCPVKFQDRIVHQSTCLHCNCIGHRRAECEERRRDNVCIRRPSCDRHSAAVQDIGSRNFQSICNRRASTYRTTQQL